MMDSELNDSMEEDRFAVPRVQTVSSTSLPKIISFEALARCGEEIWIENNGQIYRLRRTKQDKLILTK